MSVENGERFIKLLQQDPELRNKLRQDGESAFLDISAEAGASCTPFEVVSAMLRAMED
ncbi:MAG: Nif11-like leader peptide family natural product precursor [Pseudohongiellaceae bacterium]